MRTSSSRPPYSSQGNAVTYRHAHNLQDARASPRTAVPGLEPSREEPRTASRLLDPNEPWNGKPEHRKAIAVIRSVSPRSLI